MSAQVVCIVEGHGDVDAVPTLVRRIAAVEMQQVYVHSPIRIPKTSLLKAGEFERAVELAARKTRRQGGILVLLDSDDDCPAKLGPDLLQRSSGRSGDVPTSVVLARREFESWFLAAAISLRGVRGLSNQLLPPPNPEAVVGAKEWLTAQMSTGRRYRPTVDQAALAERFDLAMARQADSFEKCYREIAKLVRRLNR
jgi:hypothetical protein